MKVRPAGFLQGAGENATVMNSSQLPAEKSWLHLRTANMRRNQGTCGSCWALAAVAVLQSASEIHGKYRTFSVQEIVSCVPNPQECGGQGGCRGATVELAMDWVLKHGLAQEHEIPYEASDGYCNTHNHMSHVSTHASTVNAASSFGLTGWETLPQNKYLPLLQAVQHGPVAVSVSASGWVSYYHGVFNGCPVDAIIDHAVTLYGYGQDASLGGEPKFWMIQNSWGRNWGEDGRIRILRRDNDETQCGVNRRPEVGTGCKGGPSQVPVCGMCGILYDSVVAHFA